MSKHDKRICALADSVRGCDYAELDRLQKQCTTDAGRAHIEGLMRRAYRREEACAGMN